MLPNTVVILVLIAAILLPTIVIPSALVTEFIERGKNNPVTDDSGVVSDEVDDAPTDRFAAITLESDDTSPPWMKYTPE